MFDCYNGFIMVGKISINDKI